MAKFLSARPVQNMRHGIHLIRNRKSMWQMIREVLGGRYRMSALTVLAIILALAYVIFPFDLIPDVIPVVGWMDDGFVIFLLIKRLSKETERYNRFKAAERRNG